MRSYHVTTFGCQMNEHDSEHMKGMLEALGYSESQERSGADLILFNTCSRNSNCPVGLSTRWISPSARRGSSTVQSTSVDTAKSKL